MAESNKMASPGGMEQPAPEAQADSPASPAAPPLENLAPDIADSSGDVVVPSNVISCCTRYCDIDTFNRYAINNDDKAE